MLQAGFDQQEARRCYAQAIAADPRFPLPYVQAAELEASAGHWELVFEYADRAIHLDPDSYPRAYLLSATAKLNQRQYGPAALSAAAGLSLDKEHAFPELEYDLGIALIGQGDRSTGAGHLKAYLSLAPKGPNAVAASRQLASLETPK